LRCTMRNLQIGAGRGASGAAEGYLDQYGTLTHQPRSDEGQTGLYLGVA